MYRDRRLSRGRALAAIGQVTVLVLLVWGEQDRLVTRPVIDHALARRPDWRLHVLESAGHALQRCPSHTTANQSAE